MSIDAIKAELSGLDSERRREIITYLVAMNQRDNTEYQAAMARKIDDKDPAHWLTLEEFEKRLALRDNERPE